jgi:hypothetical protein
MMLFRDSHTISPDSLNLPQNGTVSLKRIQELSTEVRLNLKNYFLSTFSKIEDYKRLEKPLSELKEREELYKKHEVLTGHEIKMLYMNFNVAKIKREFKACTELMKEILKFSEERGQSDKRGAFDTPAILKTFQQIIEENQDSKMDKLDEHEYQVFEILSEKGLIRQV